MPATSSNVDLCRLLLSTTALQYPTPILINWAATENQDAYVQHLAKVETILKYLDKLFWAGKQDDLVLIVDGYDIHFQLPPSVMIERYFEVNALADKRTESKVGKWNMRNHDLKQTVIFGHDKLCWPMEFRRPACWAVPTPLNGEYAFGPNTDRGDPLWANAVWLNSGTIMGPVGDVRDVFLATLELIHVNHTTDSDQYYFANVFGMQEYARRLLQADPFGDVEGKEKDWPVLEEGEKTEYHIGIDYDGALFQTMAFYRQTITWMTFDGNGNGNGKESYEQNAISSGERQSVLQPDPYYDKQLPQDLETSNPPFSAAAALEASNLPGNISWSDLSLGINSISKRIFPLLHFTGPKEFRELWWGNMWYVPYGEELLKASARVEMPRVISDKKIGGKVWWHAAADTTGNDTAVTGTGMEKGGGAIGDNGESLSWNTLCGVHEAKVFGKE